MGSIAVSSQLVEGFLELFDGNTRRHGKFDATTGRMTFVDGPVTHDLMLSHLLGDTGVGVVPVRDDGTCSFAAVDIDCHDGKLIDLSKLAVAIERLKLPVVMTRSKSGGAHVWAFFTTPELADRVRTVMRALSVLLGYGKAEIFPKQSNLRYVDEDEVTKYSDGSWINIPYFFLNANKRYGVVSIKGVCKRLTMKSFIACVSEIRCSVADLEDAVKLAGKRTENRPGGGVSLVDDHLEAPPCIKALMMGEVQEGYRNTVLYSVTIYLKKAFPNNYRDMARAFNEAHLRPPLPVDEAERTIKSASRRDYLYKCNEEPLCSLCDSTVCLTKKYGITGNDFAGKVDVQYVPGEVSEAFKFDQSNDLGSAEQGDKPLAVVKFPVKGPGGTREILVGPLVKQMTDPVKWLLKVDDHTVIASTKQLNAYQEIRQLLQETASISLPVVSNKAWTKVVDELVNNSATVSAPEGASRGGLLGHCLTSYAQDAVTSATRGDRFELVVSQGRAAITEVNGEDVVCFQMTGFLEYVQLRKLSMGAADIWTVIQQKFGATKSKMRIGGVLLDVVCVPKSVFAIPSVEVVEPEFNDEI